MQKSIVGVFGKRYQRDEQDGCVNTDQRCWGSTIIYKLNFAKGRVPWSMTETEQCIFGADNGRLSYVSDQDVWLLKLDDHRRGVRLSSHYFGLAAVDPPLTYSYPYQDQGKKSLHGGGASLNSSGIRTQPIHHFAGLAFLSLFTAPSAAALHFFGADCRCRVVAGHAASREIVLTLTP
jgi:hypothetical protein